MSKEPWKKDLAELAETVEERFQSLRKEIGEKSSSRHEGESELPLYRCKGKDCAFSTDSIEDYVEHRLNEVLESKKTPDTETPVSRPVKHETAEDYLNCPECFPKFEKAFLKRGYTKKEEKKEKPKGTLL